MLTICQLVAVLLVVSAWGCAQQRSEPFGDSGNAPCSLSARGLADRKAELRTRLKPGIQEVTELPDGYGLRFPGDGEWDRQLTEFVLYERGCCSSISYELSFDRHGGPIWLRLRGDAETKAFLAEALGDVIR